MSKGREETREGRKMKGGERGTVKRGRRRTEGGRNG